MQYKTASDVANASGCIPSNVEMALADARAIIKSLLGASYVDRGVKAFGKIGKFGKAAATASKSRAKLGRQMAKA